ncbi:MAG: hypothetical protein C0392_15940 [Syntrophus sp. (in: bacteria)]|nr:hypothetical protein [Syntrophus sp. (in: bacteria)]
MGITSINRPNSDKTVQELSGKQLKLLSNLLEGRSFEEACKLSGVAKSTGYTWMHQTRFKEEYDRRREELYRAAFEKLMASTEQAVKAYTGLLSSDNEPIRARVCEGILDRVLKFHEDTDIISRIDRIEHILSQRGGSR